MALATTNSTIQYTGTNTANQVCPIPFRFFSNTDLVVQTLTSGGTLATLVLGTHYSVTGADQANGGAVTIFSATPATTKIQISRDVPETQLVSFTTGDRLPASTLERALDKLTMLVQELSRGILRSIRVSDAAPVQPALLPPSSAVLGTDSTATIGFIESKSVGGIAPYFLTAQAPGSQPAFTPLPLLTANRLMDGAVQTSKILDGAVTNPKIEDGAVSTNKIQDASVITAKLQNDAVTPEKIGGSPVSGKYVLTSTDGETAWQSLQNTGAVTSVNTKTGSVVLNASDVGAVSKNGDTINGAINIASGGLKVGDEDPENVNVQINSGSIELNNGASINFGGVGFANAQDSLRTSIRASGTQVSNTFTRPQVISTTSPTGDLTPALRVTQAGGGEALRVEDSTTPDSTAFVVSTTGKVGIGVSPDVSACLSVDGNGVKFSDDTYQTSAGLHKTGGTMTGKLNLPAVTTSSAPLNIGTANTDPVVQINGDLWMRDNQLRYKGSTIPTGGGAYIVAATNEYNTFGVAQAIQVTDNSRPALRVSQLGTGEALRVEDESPESTPFVVSAGGRVGIGVTPDASVCLSLDSTGVKFSDGTIQTTAGGGGGGAVSSVNTKTGAVVLNASDVGSVAKTGDTMTGKLTLPVSGSLHAPLNMQTGSNPTSPSNGDIWMSGDRIRYRASDSTNRIVAVTTDSNSFTKSQVIATDVATTTPALKITQLGTGDALLVQDDTDPDATAFAVNQHGRVGIGVAPAASGGAALSIDAGGIKFNDGSTQSTAAVAPPIYQATYYRITDLSTTNGNMDIPFDQVATGSNPNGFITQVAGTADFNVVQAGLYQLELHVSVLANNGSWNTGGDNKIISIDILRPPTAEQALISQTAAIANGKNYSLSLSATYRLNAGDRLNMRHYGVWATAAPLIQSVTNSFDFNTFFSWRFIGA